MPALTASDPNRGGGSIDPGALAAATAFALGTYAAFGVVGVYGETASTRVALLPSPWALILPALCALGYVAVFRPSASDVAPLWLPAVALMPWLPLPAPAVALLWSGPLAIALVIAAIAGTVLPRLARAIRGLARPSSHLFAAFLIAAILYVASAWRLSNVLPNGDEPHYLVIAESLLDDGDLRIENNHAERGYLAYVDRELKPDYLRRGRDGRIYSIHAPGLSLLVLPAFAVAGYPGVALFLALMSAAGSLLAWRAAYHVTGDMLAAWIGWAAVALSVPFFFQAFTIFPDAPAAVIMALVVYALAREPIPSSIARIASLGAALAVLPWLHTRYSALAGAAAVVVAMRLAAPPREVRDVVPGTRRRHLLLAFMALPILSAAAWLMFFQDVYGTFDPRAPYGGATDMRLARVPVGVTGLLVDQQFGLLPNAPIYLIALAGMAALFRLHRRLALEMMAIALPYVIAVAAFHMWWAGLSSPARFLVPVLLPMAIPVAAYWRRHETPTPRAALFACLAASVALTATLACAPDGALVYNIRDGYALWLDWVAPAVNLTYAFPSLFQGDLIAAGSRAALWAGVLTLGWFVMRAAESRVRARGYWFLTAALTACATLMLGAGAASSLDDHNATEPGTSAIAVLADACATGRTALQLAPLQVGVTPLLGSAFTVADASRRPARNDGPVWTGRDVPPGRYRVVLDSGLRITGGLSIALGRPDDVLQRCAFTDHGPGATGCVIDLPAGATWLWLSPDPSLRSSIDGIRLQPIELGTSGTCDLRADRAVIMPAGAIFAQREDILAEPAGLWIVGGGSGRLALRTRGPARLHLRNGAAVNVVRLSSGEWRQERRLASQETMDVEVPAAPRDRPVLVAVHSEAGFRPADLEPGNRDLRWLGVWVELR